MQTLPIEVDGGESFPNWSGNKLLIRRVIFSVDVLIVPSAAGSANDRMIQKIQRIGEA